jgi:hypothetical protein
MGSMNASEHENMSMEAYGSLSWLIEYGNMKLGVWNGNIKHNGT